ncbi:MAG: flagellar export chaperone FliS [Selenomonadales bacterium]|nr:flagellar export chaperone FliS [Selenomonadales bacterium]
MAMPNPYATYQEQSVFTASQADLTLMLYNGCIKFLSRAELAMQRKDVPGANDALLRAQDIILEFMATLDMQYDISHQLMALYEYLRRRMIEANLRKEITIVQECLSLVTELRDTWAKAVKLSRGQVG